MGIAGAGDAEAVAKDEAPAFEDVTASLGIRFVHDNDANGRFLLPEEIGPGAAFIDYDNDGDLDIFIAGGGSITGDGPPQFSVLYRNDGERFTDVTQQANAAVIGPAYGVACADIDGDGYVDIFVSRLGGNVMLRNRGDGTFEDFTDHSGVRSDGFGTGAAFLDFDHDGLIDLYVCRYVDWRIELEQQCFISTGIRDYCSPNAYSAQSTDRLFRNLGNGRFEDVSAAAGIEASRGNGLGVVAHDFDGDGWIDLYVANDATPAFLWRNNGDGTFENVAELRGCAFDGQGIAIAGMGVACEDFDGDGWFDLIVTNIRNQSNLVLENRNGMFTDVSAAYGVPAWSMPKTAFGIAVFDQNHDGELDALVANGAVNVMASTARLDNPYAEPLQFLRLRNGRFVDHSSAIGPAVNDVCRAVALGDFDNDGDLDALITACGGRVYLLRNTADRTSPEQAWLMLDVRSVDGRSSAIGARVEVVAGDRTWRREVRPQSSYFSSHDPRVHFGLGRVQHVDRVKITWPDGATRVMTNVPVRQHLVVSPSEDMDRSEEVSP